MWSDHLPPMAAAGHRVVAMDLPGFGDAPAGRGPLAHARDVLATMDTLGIPRAALVGNSWGAGMALRAAALAPDRVSHLVLVSAGDPWRESPSTRLAAAWKAEEAALAAGERHAGLRRRGPGAGRGSARRSARRHRGGGAPRFARDTGGLPGDRARILCRLTRVSGAYEGSATARPRRRAAGAPPRPAAGRRSPRL